MKLALIIQLALFLVVAGFMLASGDYRYGIAQGLLCAVNVLLFWPVLSS